MKQRTDNPKKEKKAWPTKDAMAQIYEKNLWGSNQSEFYSGLGSHDPEIINPYLEVVSSFLSTFNPRLTVCDLGCGDFNVGSKLIDFTKKYYAIDIVESLIEYNKTRFKEEDLKFLCLDIAEDSLPVADCVIVRQVLQHLSNAEVARVVKKLIDFKYVILTEHLPDKNFEPNMDIISGQGTRLKKNSGINLLASPFNLEVYRQRELLSVRSPNFKGFIVTTLYQLY
ncbi:Methyltransferase domain-containing protein [Gillisia sp. Hel1_33_143]|uniref:class I SAM-dependent methyltransferase n=1 Tax=Gillisia sp. Hel1_33_143 TaxID=1336796 RepID=UPI00087A9B88|nr:methyltransferase domain-containing protein [Gillisia sp. Hel1_33_143]SDS10092.1 Methyltransferase domain-containing protein [Gillisia sp. Hel1_33_143]